MNELKELVLHSLEETLKMVPLLLLIYVAVEWIEHKYGEAIQYRLRNASKAGPLAGAVFGCVPQCGFSVLAGAMYSRRFITTGTLLAVLLSTSDEAIPVILAQPGSAVLVVPLLLTKVVVGLLGGYAVDFAMRRRTVKTECVHEHDEHCEHSHKQIIHERGCCEHDIPDGTHKWQFLVHPLVHTAKVFAFLFAVTLSLNYGIDRIGEENLEDLLLQGSVFQPIVTALVGLIPNCASSVAITEVYLMGHISYGSAIAGLCASGGLGILVLFKENRSLLDTMRILGLLLGISILVGIVLQYTVHAKPSPGLHHPGHECCQNYQPDNSRRAYHDCDFLVARKVDSGGQGCWH